LETEAVDASGNKLINKQEGLMRFVFQNIHGNSIREGLQLMLETATIGALQIDVAIFTETNVHWNQENRKNMTQQL